MKALLIIALSLLNLTASAQNASIWKVSSFNNFELQDSFLLLSGQDDDTSVYYIPEIIYMCKFGNKLLMVDFQEHSVSLLPLMTRCIKYSGVNTDLGAIVDSMSKRTFNGIPQKDSVYVYSLGNTYNRLKIGADGEIAWMEITVYDVAKDAVGNDDKTKFTRTIYTRANDLDASKMIRLSEYLDFTKGKVRLNSRYSGWEFNNLLME